MEKDLQDSDLTSAIAEPTDFSAPPAVEAEQGSRLQRLWRAVSFKKIGLFIISLFLFILALTLMKDGARGLAPFVENRFSLDSAANTMGFGWLFPYLVMSGSPVAASALTFLDAGIITAVQTFTMIIGSHRRWRGAEGQEARRNHRRGRAGCFTCAFRRRQGAAPDSGHRRWFRPRRVEHGYL